jgi:kinetochore protein Mis13/DSN1
MEDEADRLRRQSRARALVDQSLLASTHSSSQSDNSMFNFPPPSTSKSQPKPAGANKSRNKLTITAMEVDTQVPIPQNETPQQQRNKRLREGAMAAIREDQEGEERGRDSGRGSGQRSGSRHRRASSLSRGKRISTSYQQTGVISAYSCDCKSIEGV